MLDTEKFLRKALQFVQEKSNCTECDNLYDICGCQECLTVLPPMLLHHFKVGINDTSVEEYLWKLYLCTARGEPFPIYVGGEPGEMQSCCSIFEQLFPGLKYIRSQVIYDKAETLDSMFMSMLLGVHGYSESYDNRYFSHGNYACVVRPDLSLTELLQEISHDDLQYVDVVVDLKKESTYKDNVDLVINGRRYNYRLVKITDIYSLAIIMFSGEVVDESATDDTAVMQDNRLFVILSHRLLDISANVLYQDELITEGETVELIPSRLELVYEGLTEDTVVVLRDEIPGVIFALIDNEDDNFDKDLRMLLDGPSIIVGSRYRPQGCAALLGFRVCSGVGDLRVLCDNLHDTYVSVVDMLQFGVRYLHVEPGGEIPVSRVILTLQCYV